MPAISLKVISISEGFTNREHMISSYSFKLCNGSPKPIFATKSRLTHDSFDIKNTKNDIKYFGA
jgi:hypothetical protein